MQLSEPEINFFTILLGYVEHLFRNKTPSIYFNQSSLLSKKTCVCLCTILKKREKKEEEKRVRVRISILEAHEKVYDKKKENFHRQDNKNNDFKVSF